MPFHLIGLKHYKHVNPQTYIFKQKYVALPVQLLLGNQAKLEKEFHMTLENGMQKNLINQKTNKQTNKHQLHFT